MKKICAIVMLLAIGTLTLETKPVTTLRLLKAATIRNGADLVRLRNVLASGDDISGVASLPTCEPRGQLGELETL